MWAVKVSRHSQTLATSAPPLTNINAIQTKGGHKVGDGGGVEGAPVCVCGATYCHQHACVGLALLQQRNCVADDGRV